VAYMETDQKEAASRSFQKACAGGIAASCYALGEMTLAEDQAAAEAFYRKACELGLGHGCYQMAKGFNRSAIAEQTMSFLRQGCEAGHSASCFSLRAAERERDGSGPT